MTTGWNSKDVKVFFFLYCFDPGDQRSTASGITVVVELQSDDHKLGVSSPTQRCCLVLFTLSDGTDALPSVTTGVSKSFFFLSVHNVNIYKKEPGDHPTVSPWNTHSWFSVLFTTNLGFEEPSHSHSHLWPIWCERWKKACMFFFLDSERKLDTQGEKWKQNSKHPDRPWPFWRKAAALTTLPLWVIPKLKIKSEQKTDKKKKFKYTYLWSH